MWKLKVVFKKYNQEADKIYHRYQNLKMKDTKTFPELQTDRLLLRQFKASDKNRIHFLRSDAGINKFIKRAIKQTLEEAVAHIKRTDEGFVKKQSVSWGIVLKGNTELIGSICLWNFSEDLKTAEVGYDLDTQFQGKGIMSEAMKAVLQFGFEQLQFETIEAFTDYRNTSSRQLLEKNNFTLNPEKKDEGNKNNVVYYLRRS